MASPSNPPKCFLSEYREPNEQDTPTILKQARDAVATTATYSLLRLNGNVEPVFLERMTRQFPKRIEKIINHLRQARNGSLGEQKFFARHNGEGPIWHVIQQLFELTYRKMGFHVFPDSPILPTFRRPGPQQANLF